MIEISDQTPLHSQPEPREQILSTKLFIPPVPANHVDRPRLAAQINAGLDKALILISAPAGYGKTSLMSHWAHETGLPYTWLSLDEGDNDPVRFMENFIPALRKVVPAIQADIGGILHRAQPASTGILLNLLINEIAQQDAPLVLVLDDFHVIQSPAVLEMLAYLLEHRPPQLHFVIITRTDPSLPLYRLRARDQLVEIRAEHLRFSTEEITAFLNEALGLSLAPEDIAALQGRTEGWIAGLQLAALSLRGCVDRHGFVSAFTGSHRYIMDYLTEEVLRIQPERVRDFLLQTSILTGMCGSLCDAVVEPENAKFNSGQATLETLEAMNLFVIPLDDRRQWYRYHHLFADVVNQRLQRTYPARLPELHQRAARWYEQHDMIFEATHHAIQAGDQVYAARLVEQNGCSLLMRGEGFTLLKWVEAVSPYTQTHPWLCILKAWALALTGSPEMVEPALTTAEGLFSHYSQDYETRIMLGNVAAVRALMANLRGDTQLAVEFARQALDDLPSSDDFSCSMRSVATSIHGDASWISGNLDAARTQYEESVRISQAAGNRYMTMIANSNLAEVLVDQGELRNAARIYTETRESAAQLEGEELPLLDRVYAGLGHIYYEWNRLEAATQQIHHCIQLCQRCRNFDLLAKEYIHLAWLERAMAEMDKAQGALEAAQQLMSERRLSPLRSRLVELSSAHWWIAQGNIEKASRLVQPLEINYGGDIPYARWHEFMLLVRLLIAQGEWEAALSLSEGLLRMAESTKRMGSVIEVLILQAIIFQGRKGQDRSLSVLGRAMSLAEPEGFTRVFLDGGEQVLRLLYQAKNQHVGGNYPSVLLSKVGAAVITEMPTVQLLIEALTLRELEVLRCIEAGSSNQDIADKLVISLPTVKRHISNIYAKMGANSRTQAVSLGRELGLLE